MIMISDNTSATDSANTPSLKRWALPLASILHSIVSQHFVIVNIFMFFYRSISFIFEDFIEVEFPILPG